MFRSDDLTLRTKRFTFEYSIGIVTVILIPCEEKRSDDGRQISDW